MKNLKLLLMLVLPALFVFTGCEEDTTEDLSPNLDFIGGTFVDEDVTLLPGEEFSVKLRATRNTTSKAKLTNFKLERTITNTAVVVDSTINEDEFDISGPLNAANIETVETFTFTITDKDGETSTLSFKVTTEGAAVTLDEELTGEMFFNVNGQGKGAFDLVGDTAVSASSSDAIKDMVNTDAIGVTFTGSWEAGTGNGSLFVKANSFDYTNASVQSATAAYDAGTPSSSVDNPADDDIYIVKLRGGSNYAVVKITDVDPNGDCQGCTSTNKGKITFSYKK